MAAAGILAFAISTSIVTMQRGFATLDTARNLTTAAQIIQSEIERMRLKDWATITAYPTSQTTIDVDSVFTDNTAIGNRFTLQREIASPEADMRQITLTISWKSIDGRTVRRSLTTYYYRNGLYDFFYNNTP